MELTDSLALLRGKDIHICDGIVIHQPTINEITDFGEQQFYSTFFSMCAIPSDMKAPLWDSGIDFNAIKDWELFLMMSKGFTKEATSLVFGDIDFSKMEMMKKVDTEELVITDGNLIITEEIYLKFISYVREMIGYVVKREKAANKFTKQILIDEDRKKRAGSSGEYSSTLVPIIISLVNTEEFSYTYEDVFGLTIYQLMKSYYQIQNKKSACALYQGSMSGFVDTSKINKSNFSWLYDEKKLN